MLDEAEEVASSQEELSLLHLLLALPQDQQEQGREFGFSWQSRDIIGANLCLERCIVMSQAASWKCLKACSFCLLCDTEHKAFVSTQHSRICKFNLVDAIWLRLLPGEMSLRLQQWALMQCASGSLHPQLLFYLRIPRTVVLSGGVREAWGNIFGLCQ